MTPFCKADKAALVASCRAPASEKRSPVSKPNFGEANDSVERPELPPLLTQEAPSESSDEESSEKDDEQRNDFTNSIIDQPEEKNVCDLISDQTEEKICVAINDQTEEMEVTSSDPEPGVDTNEQPAVDNPLNEVVDEPVEESPAEVVLAGRTVGQKLSSCVDALRKSANDEMIVAGKLSSSLSKITTFLQAVIESKGQSGGNGSPAVLHICGAPGSGKSMGVKRCCDEATAWKKRKAERWERKPKFFYINAAPLQNVSRKEALDKILKDIKMSKSQLRRSAKGEESVQEAVVVILDEIDLLVGTATEEGLRTLLQWARDENTILSLIGISNSVENTKARRLHALGLVRILFVCLSSQISHGR
jgi:hypothetical protein